MRDHGGDIDRARAETGFEGDWIDLSTGINRRPWPAPPPSAHALQALPTRADTARLVTAAAAFLGTRPDRLLPLAGASAAIALLPRLVPGRRASVLAPSYNEHAASLRAHGWQLTEAPRARDLAGDLAVLVNPNNPDGREWSPPAIAEIAGRVGHLIVDESFADPRPDLSVVPLDLPNVTVLRSFGKFWGLAGLRLGLVAGDPGLLARLAAEAGPWPVSGPALEIGAAAYADRPWAEATTTWLAEAALELDRIVTGAGWPRVGGTHLFRLYETPDAAAAQARLARAGIWARIFPWHPRWIRLGIPGNGSEFDRLARTLGTAR